MATGHSLIALIAAAALLAPPGNARAQCQPGWLPDGPGTGLDGSVDAIAWFDPDGPGPLDGYVVAGGGFGRAGGLGIEHVAAHRDGAWCDLGAGLVHPTATVLQMIRFDPDGPGSAGTDLIVAGRFPMPGANIARWDGSDWHALGDGTNGLVKAMTVHDFDGDGPGLPELVIAGPFTMAGGQPANRIARWNGEEWNPIGTGFDSWSWGALCSHDPDGAGPLAPQLFAAATGMIPSRWSGLVWQQLPLLSDIPRAMASFDPDGDGPQPARLFVGGSGFLRSWNAAAWTWETVGQTAGISVHALKVFDADGAGPGAPVLLVGGQISAVAGSPNLITWDGSALGAFGGGAPEGVTALDVRDGDESGPQVLAAMTAYGAATHVVRWAGDGWASPGTGFDAEITRLTTFDPDGPGPAPDQLLALGDFRFRGNTPLSNMARFDGADWHGFAGTDFLNGPSAAPVTYDRDGAGPQPALLVLGGSYGSAGGVLAGRGLAAWDGANWSRFGDEITTNTGAPVVFDFDHDGPQPPQVVLQNGWNVYVGTGGPWTPLPGGAAGGLFVHDPDGPGPGAPWLVGVAGTPPHIVVWNGAGWTPLGDAFDVSPTFLTSWDPDGLGPEPGRLVASGNYSTLGGVPMTKAWWDGTAWQPIPDDGLSPSPRLTSVDPDGPGPLGTQLLADSPSGFLRWTGSAWVPLGGNANGLVAAYTTWDPDGAGPRRPELVAGGDFGTITGEPSGFISRYGCAGPACGADWTADGAVTSSDISAFLAAWLASLTGGTLEADFDGSGAVNSTDISAFLAAWLAAVGSC